MRKQQIGLFICLVGLGLISGCISEDLNLSHEKVLAISIGEEGIVLPGESSFDVPLSQLIDITEDGELMIDSLTGNFLFYKRGDDLDSTIICVGQGSICDGTEDYSTMPLLDNPFVTITPNKRFPEFASLSFENTIAPSFAGDNVKDGIVDISYVETSLTIDIDYALTDVRGFEYFDKIEYVVPSFYDLEDESELVEMNVPVSEGTHSHQIHVKGVRFGANDFAAGDTAFIDPVSRTFYLRGSVKIKGTVKSMFLEEFNTAENPVIDFRLIVGTLGTSRVTGRFNQREVIDFDPIVFHDLPDFIQDEEVVVDVKNPVCRLSLKSQVPTTVSMNAEIIGDKGGVEISHVNIGEAYGTHEIKFPGAAEGETKTTNIWISRIPMEVPDSVDQNIVIPEIADIMRKIPDLFRFVLSANTDSTELTTLSLSEEYEAIPYYELVVPLQLGPNMKIVYTKEMDELGSKLKHLDFTEMNMSAHVINNLPLNVTVKAVAYDISGQELTNIALDMPVAIPAFGTSDFSFDFYSRTQPEEIKKIERVALKIYAESSEELAGHYLNKDQNLRMENVEISVK